MEASGNVEFDWSPVWLSLRVALAGGVGAFALGVLAALCTARREFRGKPLLEALLLLPLVLPPTVTGYLLLLLLGPQGLVGRWLDANFGARLLFTPWAAILAGVVVAFPLAYASAKSAFENVSGSLLDASRSLGATPWRALWSVLLPLSWPGLLSGAVLAFARALGEFGATIMVAGNIEGQTATLPVAIYAATETGDLSRAGTLCAALAALNLAFIWCVQAASARRRRRVLEL